MSESTKSSLPLWLIASLLANALLIGLLIGGGLGQRKAGPPPPSVGAEQALIRGINDAVPRDQRRTVRQIFRRAYADARQERGRVQEARRSLGQLLRADPYDVDAVRLGFQELREAELAMKSRLQDVLAEQFGELTVEQRQSILRDMTRRSRDHRRGREGDRPPPPRP